MVFFDDLRRVRKVLWLPRYVTDFCRVGNVCGCLMLLEVMISTSNYSILFHMIFFSLKQSGLSLSLLANTPGLGCSLHVIQGPAINMGPFVGN